MQIYKVELQVKALRKCSSPTREFTDPCDSIVVNQFFSVINAVVSSSSDGTLVILPGLNNKARRHWFSQAEEYQIDV